MYTRHTALKGTTAEWAKYNPILLDGEIGLEKLTNGKWAAKMGDGATKWADLAYTINFSTADDAIAAQVAKAQSLADSAKSDADRAAEIKASIPEDYQKMVDEVSSLSGEKETFLDRLGLAISDGDIVIKED